MNDKPILTMPSGERFEVVDFRSPERNDAWLASSGCGVMVVNGGHVCHNEDRPILSPLTEPNPSPDLPEEVEALAEVLRRARFLTGSVSPSDRAAFDAGMGGDAIYRLNEDIDAALEAINSSTEPEEAVSGVEIERRRDCRFPSQKAIFDLIDAACEVVNDPGVNLHDRARDAINELAAALSPFVQEVKTDRFYVSDDGCEIVFDRKTTTNGIPNPVHCPGAIDRFKFAAALNTLSKSQGES